jgi:hypothetical protein
MDTLGLSGQEWPSEPSTAYVAQLRRLFVYSNSQWLPVGTLVA